MRLNGAVKRFRQRVSVRAEALGENIQQPAYVRLAFARRRQRIRRLQFLHFLFGNLHFLLSGTEFQFAYREFLNFFLITNFYYYLYKLAEYIYTLYIALDSVWSSYRISDSRKSAIQLLIGLLLILQTAHQSSAYT